MKVGYVGNFGPPASTENHVAQAWRALGHDLTCFQENEVENWHRLAAGDALVGLDLLLWTRTGWPWDELGIGALGAHRLQREMLGRASEMGIPTVGYHLDRWHGLARQQEVHTEPFFRVSLLITADGGHEAEWKAAGVNHLWMPPGVSEFECGGGTFRPEMASDVAFVGSWMPGYHPEYPLRAALVDYLQTAQAHRCRLWPPAGEHAVRGEPLRDLYASVKILIGDSCLVGGTGRYISDRVPESLGRRGFLIHPHVDGVTDGTHYTAGKHLVTYPLGDFGELGRLIDFWLAPENQDERLTIAAAGREHVLRNHTYTVRVQEVEAVLRERGML